MHLSQLIDFVCFAYLRDKWDDDDDDDGDDGSEHWQCAVKFFLIQWISISASISTSTTTLTSSAATLLLAASTRREFYNRQHLIYTRARIRMNTARGGRSRGNSGGCALACQTNCKYLQTAAGKQICVLRSAFFMAASLFFYFYALLIYHSSRDMFVVVGYARRRLLVIPEHYVY